MTMTINLFTYRPIFFLRDPILFPSFIHTQKRNPVTHLKVLEIGLINRLKKKGINPYHFF